MKNIKNNVYATLLQTLLSIVLTFFLYKYINLKLGVSNLGVWSVVLAVTSISRLADFGIGSGVTRFVARYLANDDFFRASKVIETSFLSLLYLMLLTLPVFYVALPTLLSYILHGNDLILAISILPFSIISLGFSVVTSVFQGGLDGCHKMYLRVTIALLGQFILLLAAYYEVPINGLRGLVYAQLIQGIFVLIFSWVYLKKTITVLRFFTFRFDLIIFKEIFSYGGNIQLANIFIFLLDPITKSLIAKFSGADSAGLFEMANQLVLKIRSLIVSANQAVVPKIAHQHRGRSEKNKLIYSENIKLVVFFSAPLFSLIFASAHVASLLLLGRLDNQFVLFIHVLSIGWLFNTISVPAYFYNMGTGSVVNNTISHMSIAIVNTVFGFLLGYCFGLMGIVYSYVGALILGSLILIRITQYSHNQTFKYIEIKKNLNTIYIFLLITFSCLIIPIFLDFKRFFLSVIFFLIYILIWFFYLLKSPVTKSLKKQMGL